MSRKAHADRSTWKSPCFYAFTAGYGPFKPRGAASCLDDILVVFQHDKRLQEKDRHELYPWVKETEAILLDHDEDYGFKTILLVDLCPMIQSSEENDENRQDETDFTAALQKEAEEVELTKGFGKTVLRVLARLRFGNNVKFMAQKDACPLLLKLVSALMDQQSISSAPEIWLVHPVLSAKFVNLQLANQQSRIACQNHKKRPNLHVLFESTTTRDKRLHMIRHRFPNGSTRVVGESGPDHSLILEALQVENEVSGTKIRPREMGEQLFVSKVVVEMSKYTKQYERRVEHIDMNDLLSIRTILAPDLQTEPISSVDWSQAQKYIGALVLRGNRCVLVRSLENKWNGVKIPSLPATESADNNPFKVAASVIEHFTEVNAETEVEPLPDVPPIELFRIDESTGLPLRVQIYVLYATQPPPDGPLEDADMEDDESPYDWYTFPRAVERLDLRSVAALQTAALILVERANLGLVPCRWGGVFGQEMKVTVPSLTKTDDHENENVTGISTLDIVPEEWQPSRAGDILQDVRKVSNARNHGLVGGKDANWKLPVTVLSGFLGSGKTTLLRHVLSNYEGLKVAILVNDMGDINIDAALVKNGSNSIRQREEHLVELSNGCICCTLREDLLVEIAKIASEGTFDYLLIESSGISEPMPVAETFTFEDSTGLRLGDIAEIDTLLTVVDASRFLSELETIELLRDRNWHEDAQDERNISHLLCDQVEFANVIVLNKCDLMKDPNDKEKVKAVIRALNPTAQLVESTYSVVSLDKVLGTGLFSMKMAEKHEGWLQEARLDEHTPETVEYGISSITFRAWLPFHPDRLHKTLESMLSKKDAPYNTSIILRAKGFVWLAHRPQFQGNFSLAGNHYSLLPGSPWWAEIAKENWPDNLEEAIAPLWREPYGDRQQEMVLIGQSLDRQAIVESLEACLLNADEMELASEGWDQMVQRTGDPFRDAWDRALAEEMDHAHHHDHDHQHTASCGHLE